jgi:hypothetical protein
VKEVIAMMDCEDLGGGGHTDLDAIKSDRTIGTHTTEGAGNHFHLNKVCEYSTTVLGFPIIL